MGLNGHGLRFGVLGCILASAILSVSSQAIARPESTRATKIRLLEGYRDKFGSPPQLLILGSSRAMRAEPSIMLRRLGLRGFNAAVGSGTPPDALAYLRLARTTYPEQRFAVLWLLDIEQMRLSGISRYLRSVPRLLACLPPGARHRSSAAVSDGAAGGEGEMATTGTGSTVRYSDPHSHWAPDGFLIWCIYDYERRHGVTTQHRLQYQVSTYRTMYPPQRPDGMTGWSKWFVRQVVKDANAMGVTPVIVLTPYHPTLRHFIAALGWERVHREVRAFLRGLRRAHDVIVLDMTSVSSFGGWPDGFYDGVHPRPVMMRRLLRVVIAKAGDRLAPPSPSPSPTPSTVPTPTSPPTACPSPSPLPVGL